MSTASESSRFHDYNVKNGVRDIEVAARMAIHMSRATGKKVRFTFESTRVPVTARMKPEQVVEMLQSKSTKMRRIIARRAHQINSSRKSQELPTLSFSALHPAYSLRPEIRPHMS